MSAHWPEGQIHATSEPYVFGANETAVLQYMSCEVYQGPIPRDVTVQLSVNIEGGLLESQPLLFAELEVRSFHGISTYVKGVEHFISGCVGKKCESFGGEKYVSLEMFASRSPSGGELYTSTLNCLISGLLYD